MQSWLGLLSPDGRWMWDGARWIPAVSPDGRWWWSGREWVALAPQRPFWQRSWQSKDTVALAVWLVVVPALLVGATAAVGALGLLTTTRVEVALVVGYFAWAFIGGLIVRPSGRWREVILIAAALVVFLLLIDFAAYLSLVLTSNDQPGDDNGVGVGIMFLVVFVFPPTLIPVAFGKIVRRVLARSTPTD